MNKVICAKSFTYSILFNLTTIVCPTFIIYTRKPKLREVGYIFEVI